MSLTRLERRQRIRHRIRKRMSGTGEIPRMAVFRSNREIYVQFVDDSTGKTLFSVSSRDKSKAAKKSGSKLEDASKVGKAAASLAAEKGITSVVFDRGGYLYHGRVKALADAAREGGLKF